VFEDGFTDVEGLGAPSAPAKQSALRCNFNPQIHGEYETHCLRLIPLLGSEKCVSLCVHVLRMTFAKRALRNKQLDAAVINGDAQRKEYGP
jgi:hypothetical protein